METPSNLLLKLSQRLFRDEDEGALASLHQRSEFLQWLTQPQPFAPAILWRDPVEPVFETQPALAWQPSFVQRLHLGQQPGKHALHQQGAFYCLDFSSVFAASALLAIAPQVPSNPCVIDVCASPGGKSIFAWVALQPRLLLSNEVIGKRKGALVANLRRCRIHPAIALCLDPQVLAQEMPQTAELVMVDAPCSGQSLLAKGSSNPGCFHPVTIKRNAGRQKRILANAAQLVAPQGYLLYMTCTYAPEENEQVGEWLLDKFPQFVAVDVPHLREFRSHLSSQPCYRMFPQQGLGAGAFTMLLHNTHEGQSQPISSAFLARPGLTVLGELGLGSEGRDRPEARCS